MNCLIVTDDGQAYRWLKMQLAKAHLDSVPCGVAGVTSREAANLFHRYKFGAAFVFHDTTDEDFLDTLNQLHLCDQRLPLLAIRGENPLVDIEASRAGADLLLSRDDLFDGSVHPLIRRAIEHALSRKSCNALSSWASAPLL
jgi:hypothetical protein